MTAAEETVWRSTRKNAPVSPKQTTKGGVIAGNRRGVVGVEIWRYGDMETWRHNWMAVSQPHSLTVSQLR